MKVAVGTTNRAKLEAVRAALTQVWPEVSLVPVEVDPGISRQPLTNAEGRRGALNRAAAALKAVPEAELGIGLEGNVDTDEHGMFLLGHAAIVDAAGRQGFGSSGAVMLPEVIRRRIEAGEELGPVMQELLRDHGNNIRHSLGTNGVLTDGLYTRVDEFTDATLCALARFRSPFYN